MTNKTLLREKWLELVDDFFSDEVVQVPESIACQPTVRWPAFLKSYIKEDFGLDVRFRLYWRNRGTQDFRAIFRGASVENTTIGARYDSLFNVSPSVDTSDENRCPVLVLVPKTIEDVQWMSFRAVRSVVRLEILNKDLGGSRKFVKQLAPVRIVGSSLADRKTNLIASGFGLDLSEPPHDVIKSRPQIIDTIARNSAEVGRGVPIDLHSIAHDIIRAMWLTLSNHAIWFRFEKPLSFTYKLLDSYPCPVNPVTAAFQVVHCRVPASTDYDPEKEPSIWVDT